MNSYDSEDEFQPGSSMSAFLPLALLGVSFAIVLIFQLSTLLSQRDLLQKVISQNEAGVQQAKQMQAGLEKLIVEFNAAAPAEAQAVLARRGVQFKGNGTPASSASTAPSESPAPSPAAQ